MDRTLRTKPDAAWTFDLLETSLTMLGIHRRGVIHVGAHHGEELAYYAAAGFWEITLVEPDPENMEQITRRIMTMPPAARQAGSRLNLAMLAVGGEPGQRTFYRNHKSFFSGLKPRRRGSDQIETATFDVEVKTLAQLQAEYPGANVLVIDTQGTELDALASADLAGVDLVIIEAFERDARGRPKVACAAEATELNEVMMARGFKRAIRWVYDASGYFDVLYVPLGKG